MRLTLRTLLAYLDDILEPSQAKEIGARISENTVASSLIARIRDVTRRRRIGSPEVAGPGSNPGPNVIAEYLDNTLEPNAVGEVEKVCLDSDTHLAEVAACHQILTIVLGEPVTVRPELRERMYALGSVTDGVAPPSNAPAPAVMSAAAAMPQHVIPEYLRRQPASQRILPWVAFAALVGVCVYIVATDQDLLSGIVGKQKKPRNDQAVATATGGAKDKTGDSQDQGEANAAVTGAGVAAAKSTSDETDSTPVTPPVAAESSTTTPLQPALAESTPAEATAAEATGNPPMPAETSVTAQEAPAPGEPKTSDSKVAATPAPPAVGDKGPGEPPPPPAAGITAPVVAPPTVMYGSTEGILLIRAPGNADWKVLPRRAVLHVQDEVACPEPFTADLAITPPNGKSPALNLVIHGGGRFRILPSTGDTLMEIELNRGRLAYTRPADAPEGKMSVGLTVAGARQLLDLEGEGASCGTLVDLPEPEGPPPYEVAPRPTGTLFVAKGKVTVHRGPDDVISPDASPEWVEWTNPESKEFVALRSIPYWLDPNFHPSLSTRSYSRAFETEFLLDQSVANSIPSVLKDRRPQVSRLAALTLALVDDVDNLILALSAEHEEARLAAIVGIREWVLGDPGRAELLEPEVSRGFPDDQVALATQLLWGLTPEQAREENPSLAVVEALASDNIAIRELAFFQVHKITGKDLGYRPLNSEVQRDGAVTRWRDSVRRNHGLLPVEKEK